MSFDDSSTTGIDDNAGLTLVRVALGIVFTVSGVGKVLGVGPKAMGIGGFAGFLGGLGVPFPTLAAWAVGLLELVGGVLLLVGLLTRIVSVLLAINMAAALVLVHLPSGFVASNGGYEYVLVLALCSLGVAVGGPGALSVDAAVDGRTDPVASG